MNRSIAVSAAMILRDGELLISQRKNGLWEFPGGKIESGEDPRRTVERELKEELDLSVKAGPIYDVVHHEYPELTVTMLVFLCKLTGEYAPKLLDGPIDVKWVPLAALCPEEFLEADRPMIAALRCHHEQVLELAGNLWQSVGWQKKEENN